MFALWENRINAIGRSSKLLEHRHQRAGGNVGLHLPAAAPGNTPAAQAPVVQHLAVRAIERAAGFEVHHLSAFGFGHAKSPAPGLRGVAGQGQAVQSQQIGRRLGAPMARQVGGRGHAHAPVVGQAHANQGRIGQVAHPHRAVKTFAGQVDHAVAQIERDRHLGMQVPKPRHQWRHMAPPKTGRRRQAQMPAGLDTARAHAGLGIVQVG